MQLDCPVTIFVGENGTGKSTLLEGVAVAVGSVTVGNESIEYDKTLEHALMAFPGAAIISFDHSPVDRVKYDELEHVKLTRDFLNNPQQFLRHL